MEIIREDKRIKSNQTPISSISLPNHVDSIEIEDVQFILEWAGLKLLSLPVYKLKPNSYINNWPEYKNEMVFRSTYSPLKPNPPNSFEIDLLDNILNLIQIVPDPISRRIIQARSLISPLTHRHIYHWETIAKILSSNRYLIRRQYLKGLNQILDLGNKEKIRLFKLEIN